VCPLILVSAEARATDAAASMGLVTPRLGELPVQLSFGIGVTRASTTWSDGGSWFDAGKAVETEPVLLLGTRIRWQIGGTELEGDVSALVSDSPSEGPENLSADVLLALGVVFR
jgi:hypothetical protein